jgi:hypothetical protein
MAVTLNKFVVILNITVPAGTLSTVVPGDPGSGGAAGYGDSSATPMTTTPWGYGVMPLSFQVGTAIVLDSGGGGTLYNILAGLSAIRAYIPGQDDVSHAGIGN